MLCENTALSCLDEAIIQNMEATIEGSKVSSTFTPNSSQNLTITSDYYSNTDVQQAAGYEASYGIIIPFIIVACGISFCLNCFVLFLIRWLRKPLSTNILLTMGLACADCWASFSFAGGFVILSYLPHFFQVDVNECLALAFEALRLGAVLTSALHLLLLAVNHYLAIAYPMEHHSILTREKTKLCMLAAFIIPPTSYMVAFGVLPGQGFQSPNCSNIEFYHGFSFRATVSSLFFVPFVVIACLYLAMYIQLNKASKRDFKRINGEGKKATRDLRRKKRTLFTTFIMVLSFCIGWFPSVIFFLVTSQELDIHNNFMKSYPNLVLALSTTVNMFIVCKFFVNPIIYALRIPEMQEALRGCLRIKSLRARALARHENRYTCEMSWTTENGPSLVNHGSSGRSTALGDHTTLHSALSAKLVQDLSSNSPSSTVPKCEV